MAAYLFRNYTLSFPNSKHTEECAYMVAYCYYKEAPTYSLDNTNTHRAIKELQSFADRYPKSGRIEECNLLIDELRKFNKSNSYINAAIIGNDISENLTDIKKNYTLFNSNNFYIFFTLDDILSENIDDKKNNKINENKNFFDTLKKNYFLKKINNFLRTKSYTYLWIKAITTNPSERYFYESYNHYKNDDKIKFLSNQIEKINNFKNLHNLNIKIIILPFEFQTRKNCDLKFLLPQDKLVKILKNNKLEYINLSNDFCSHVKSRELFLKFDPVHLSEAGHDFVFNLIKNKIN